VALDIRGTLGLLRESANGFMRADCPRMAAALSYYTVFSIPPLLVVVIAIAGFVWDPNDVRGAIEGETGRLVGPEGAAQMRTILESADSPGAKKGLAAIVGLLVLIFGATGAFIQLQSSLNDIWEVEPDPKKGGIRNFVMKRIFSFGMVLAIAFMLLVSLALSTALSAVGDAIGGGASETILLILNFVLSFVVITCLFAAMFKMLPDAEIAWRDVWVGAIVTTLLFMIGKAALTIYLGRSDPGSAFGAAGSLALILIWVYYASMILFFGAEFTETWATEKGSGIRPEPGATRVIEKKQRIRDGKPAEVERK
jgi:membrane protein